MKEILVLTLLFYSLLVLQTSFLASFAFFRSLPGLAIIFFLLVNLIQDAEDRRGLLLALPTGILLDLSTGQPLGFYPALLILFSVSIKFLIKRYVRV